MGLISIIGSGRIGSTVASQLLPEIHEDIILIDVIPELPKGEALDLGHMAAQYGSDIDFRGSSDFRDMEDSDLVIVTGGLARKPGMTRLDLLQKNAAIIKDIAIKIREYAPKAKVLMVTNPMDAMTYVALKVTGFPPSRVFGMGGMLDLSRFKYFLAQALHVSYASIHAMVIGEHGENMVPLPRYSSVAGIPIPELLSEEEMRGAVEKTIKVAAEVIALKGATIFAPAQGVVKMVKAILEDGKSVFPLSAYLQGEYGVRDLYIGVPAILGRGGVEKIIELKLTEEEHARFMKGAETLKEAISTLSL